MLMQLISQTLAEYQGKMMMAKVKGEWRESWTQERL
jgi:hypothetical protein